MSALQAVTRRPQPQRFLRKTSLLGSESNTNFKMLDDDIGEAVTSEEADRVTPLMSKIYTRLLLTPPALREGARTLRFIGEEKEDGTWMTAWVQLCRHLRVSSETASKALSWMHAQGIIGYFAGKNGVGIRIFLNRAAASITVRQCPPGQKKLPQAHASVHQTHTSPNETPLNCSFAEEEVLETDLNPPAPKNGADESGGNDANRVPKARTRSLPNGPEHRLENFAPPGGLVEQLCRELESRVRAAAAQAAAREHERTREWLERSGIPKAARVAQRESYGVLRAYGLVGGKAAAQTEVGRRQPPLQLTRETKALTIGEIRELAETCVALLEVQKKPIETTLSEILADGKGWLGAADAERVKMLANQILDGGGKPEHSPMPAPRVRLASLE